MLVAVNAKWGFGTVVSRASYLSKKDRLKRLARRIDALTRLDQTVIQRTREITALRRQAALELHTLCAAFVSDLDDLLNETSLELDPIEYRPENFQDHGINLFQINAQGRILQIKFEATAELTSTENFRVPYILEGAVRCFNQQLLEQDLIEEQLLYYTLEKRRNQWRFFDARTYRSGPLDIEYLIGLMEQLV